MTKTDVRLETLHKHTLSIEYLFFTHCAADISSFEILKRGLDSSVGRANGFCSFFVGYLKPLTTTVLKYGDNYICDTFAELFGELPLSYLPHLTLTQRT